MGNKCNCNFFRIYFHYFIRICLITTGIPKYIIEIVNTEIVFRRFIFNYIVLPEYSSNILTNTNSDILFDNQNIYLHRFLSQEVFLFY